MNRRARLLLPLLAAGLLAGKGRAAAPGPLVLAENGSSSYSICLGGGASPSERRGAAELQRFLEEISGARLPIVTDADPAAGNLILVGASRALDRLNAGVPVDRLGGEGFALKASGPHLIIAGGRPRGTMYGVYAFLEKLGCRWFTPEVSRIPRMRRIAVEPPDETRTPAFEYREPFVAEAFDKDWAARNKTNGHASQLDESTGDKVRYYPFVHTFEEILPPEKHFRDHPEYFSLVAGKRRAGRSQLCLTNREVLRLATEKVLEWIRDHPEATIFSVSQNDWPGWCECENCRRVEEEEGGAHIGPVLRFVNAIAEEVAKRHPDKLIDTLAYRYTEAPPAKTRPRPNVRIRLCPIGACEAHPYEKCDRNAYFVNNLRAWAKITNQLYVWHYNTNFSHYLLPFPDFDELAADIPLYRRNGVVGLFMEGGYAKGGGSEMGELRSYVMARLLWDTAANADRDIDEFLEGVYGAAAKPMRAYYDLLHRQVRPAPEGLGHHLWIYQNPNAPYLGGDFLDRAEALFREAEALAGGEAVRRRVRKARLPLDYVRHWRAREFSVREGSYEPSSLEALREGFAELMAAVRSFGVTELHEGRGLEWDEQEFAARMRPYRVITLENAALRADLVPELSGRIVRLIDKRSGAGVLPRPDPGERGYPDVSGLAAFVYPDYQARPVEVRWELEKGASDGEAVLAGAAAGGLTLRRTIRLDGRLVRTETLARNGGTERLSLALQERVEYTPGRAEDPRIALAFRAADGRSVDRDLFRPGLETQDSATYAGADLPSGEWRFLHRAGGPAMTARFPRELVSRAVAAWTVRGENRVTATLWSEERDLAPGDSLRLTAGYLVEGDSR